MISSAYLKMAVNEVVVNEFSKKRLFEAEIFLNNGAIDNKLELTFMKGNLTNITA
jgi:hypothetical protein